MNLSHYHDTIKSFMKNMLLESQVVSQRYLLVTKEKIYKGKSFRYQLNHVTKVNISNNAET